MKNKRIVNQLKKFDENDAAKITLTMGRKTLTEICYHRGDWNKKSFICDSVTSWRSAELFTEDMSVDEIIELFNNKNLNELQDTDFHGLSVIETNDGSTEIQNLEFEQPLSESEDEELNLMDLHNFSEITDFQYEFEPGSIESIKIEIGDNFSTTLS